MSSGIDFDDLYSRDATRIRRLLDTGEAAWEAADARGRFALEQQMAASRDRLTAANGRALLAELTRPRPAWARWVCVCAGPPRVTAVSPGFEILLADWVRREPAMLPPISLLLQDDDPDIRSVAQSACAQFAEQLDCGGPEVVEGLWKGEADGDYMAGVVLARHALTHGVQSALERVLRAPGDAARGAVFALDQAPGQADLAALQPVLEHLEKKGAKASREGASRILARSFVMAGDREALQPRLFRRNASIRAQTAAGLRNAARDGIDIGCVLPDLRTVATEAAGFRRQAAQEALIAGGPDTIVVGMGSGSGSLTATIDLDAGILERRGTGFAEARYRIDPAMVSMLRRRAEKAHAEGDQHRRDQFAQASVSYELRLGGRAVTWRFDIEGSRTHTLVEPIYDYVSTSDEEMAAVRLP